MNFHIIKYIMTREIEAKGRATYVQISEILSKHPFDLKGEELHLLSRYITEGEINE